MKKVIPRNKWRNIAQYIKLIKALYIHKKLRAFSKETPGTQHK
ncbi:hypothetical protein LEP1GSC125_1104 [Leptospira mayottensis 200901122]|uniref:Uncharacterized protein n=1 Tax=Leptospira mayottensis 200901122 TaxID=1193010 RepID=A0AA87SVQ4_9LEPT|nr:hypothetical protein LEP1GSC125_1104 [Leptospira mayottensis 200901122]